MKKKFVIDTNVLLHDPNCIFKFEEHEIILPITVIEELDRKKKDNNEVGKNARTVSRHLKNLRLDEGLLNKGCYPTRKAAHYVSPPNYWMLPDGFEEH